MLLTATRYKKPFNFSGLIVFIMKKRGYIWIWISIVFGKALSYLLEQKGKGAAASIAAETGITKAYLKNIRSGSGVGSVQTLRKITVSADSIFLICVEGESISPTIADSDTVIVDADCTQVRSGAIYAIGTGDAVIVKRLELMVDGNALVISDNRLEYPRMKPGLKTSGF